MSDLLTTLLKEESQIQESNFSPYLLNVKDVVLYEDLDAEKQQEENKSEEEKQNDEQPTEIDNAEDNANISEDIEETKEEQQQYITNIKDFYKYVYEKLLFSSENNDKLINDHIENLLITIESLSGYNLLPRKIKIRKDNLDVKIQQLQKHAQLITENFNPFDYITNEVYDSVKSETNNSELANDISKSVTTYLIAPLLLINMKDIKTEEQEIAYNILKTEQLSLLSIFTSKVLWKM